MARADTLTGRHEAAGLRRRFRLVLPGGPGRAAGLVVLLHGCTQDAEDLAAGTGMDEAATARGWAVLYPEQDPDAHPQTCWRWYEADQRRPGSGEAALIADLAGEVAAERLVEDAPVWIGGISAGAAMALNVFALRPDLFAGVGLHSGVPYAVADDQAGGLAAMAGQGPDAAELSRRLAEAVAAGRSDVDAPAGGRLPPLLVVHGTADDAVDPSNAARLVESWHGAGSLLARGVEPDGPGGADPTEPSGPSEPSGPAGLSEPAARDRGEDGRPFERLRWPAAGGRGPMELWRVEGLGHAWSGGHPGGSYADPEGPPATRAMLRFFRRTGMAGDGR